MSFVNNFVAPPALQHPNTDLLYGTDPYDINFAFPLYPETLENERIRLTPFIPALHAQAYWDAIGPLGTATFRYYPFYHATLGEFLAFIERIYRTQPEALLFAVIDKTRAGPFGGALAGTVSMFKTAAAHLCTEVGHVVVLPAFRGTHVARNMVGLLLRYLLQLPRAAPPGLGFRRVAWSAHPRNEPSKGLARTMGFRVEGEMRWTFVLPEVLAPEGLAAREGGPLEHRMGRGSTVLAICWDDWENKGRENAEAKMAK